MPFITVTNNCIEWNPRTHNPKFAYGRWYIGNGKRELAHREMWRRKNGAIPKGLNVLHKCDNPICINLEHLFLGSALDNVQDMDAKGRRKPRGYSNRAHCKFGHILEIRHKRRVCRVCLTSAQRRYREQNLERCRESVRRWRRFHSVSITT